MKKVDLKDDIILYEVKPNKYGDVEVSETHASKGLFTFGVSEDHSNFQDNIQTQAHTYLDVDDEWIISRCMRLEGYYLSVSRYGQEQWFKIHNVLLGEEKLTNNQINNIHVNLEICDPIYIPVPESS